MAIVGFDVPSAVFDRGTRGAVAALRKALFNTPGWVLGRPIWMQGDEVLPSFVLQVNEDFGLNLGDSGTLAVGTQGAILQCP